MIPNLLASVELLHGAEVPTQCMGAVSAIVNHTLAPIRDGQAPGVDIIVGLVQTPEHSTAAVAWLAGFAAELLIDLAEEIGREPEEFMQSLALRHARRFV